MKKSKNLLLNVCIIVLFSLVLFNCPLPDDNGPLEELMGYWKSQYNDGFEIMEPESSSDNYLFYQYDNDSKDVSFAGDIVNVRTENTTTGYITILITDTGTWGKTEDEYYVIHWQDLDGDTVEESCAFKMDGESTMSGQDDAEDEFTVENGYFEMHGSYTRQ